LTFPVLSEPAWCVTADAFRRERVAGARNDVHLRAVGLHFRPRLPRAWHRLAYTVVWRGRRIAVAITPETVSVRLVAGTLPVTIHGRSVTLTRRMVSLPLRPAKQ
jgi:trehalose/maltose hydrolase-like predicted phosphorylase